MVAMITSSRSGIVRQRHHRLAMLGRRGGRHEPLVRRHHCRTDPVREREIHAIVNRVVKGQRQTGRVCHDGLIVAERTRLRSAVCLLVTCLSSGRFASVLKLIH